MSHCFHRRRDSLRRRNRQLLRLLRLFPRHSNGPGNRNHLLIPKRHNQHNRRFICPCSNHNRAIHNNRQAIHNSRNMCHNHHNHHNRYSRQDIPHRCQWSFRRLCPRHSHQRHRYSLRPTMS